MPWVEKNRKIHNRGGRGGGGGAIIRDSRVYEFPQQLPNELRLRILGDEERPGTAEKWTLKLSRIVLFRRKTKVCLTYPVYNCPWKQIPAANLTQFPSNLFFWQIFACEKALNFVLLDNYFTDPLTEVQIRYRNTCKFGPGRFLER